MDMVALRDRDMFMVIVNGWEPDCPLFDGVKVKAGRRLQAGRQKLRYDRPDSGRQLQKAGGHSRDLFAAVLGRRHFREP